MYVYIIIGYLFILCDMPIFFLTWNYFWKIYKMRCRTMDEIIPVIYNFQFQRQSKPTDG